MKYIKKMILENFQSHKYTEIEFDQYLNVIVGPSDQGKSAIIRALKWAIFNEPSGDFFIREGEKECSVTVIFNDLSKVKRYRSKTKNAYYFYDNNGEETVYEGFGTKVPPEISDKISMRKVILDSNQSNSINIGEQLEGPFLLSEKNATKANAIGRLVGVHIVDDALKDVLKDIRNLNIKRKGQEEMLESLRDNLTKYDYLDDIINRTKKVEDIKDCIKKIQLKLSKLNELSERLDKTNKEAIVLKDYLNKLKDIHIVIGNEKELTNKINGYNYIQGKYKRLKNIKKQIEYDNKLLASLKNVSHTEEIIKLLNINYNKLVQLININTRSKYISNNIIKNQNLLEELQHNDRLDKINHLIGQKHVSLLELLNIKREYDTVRKRISIGTIYIEKLKDTDSIFNIKNSLETNINRLDNLMNHKNKYTIITRKKLETTKSLTNIEVEVNKLLQHYKDILIEVKICPLCFSNIDKCKIDEIISNYK